SSLCATNASSTSFFSRSGTSKWSSEFAKTSPAASNSSDVNFISKCVGSKSKLPSFGIVLTYFSGPPAFSQTHIVLRTLNPGDLQFLFSYQSFRYALDVFVPTNGSSAKESIK